MSETSIKQVDASNIQSAIAYLKTKEEASQFLLNNLKAHGPTLSEHHNSGNYKLILGIDRVEGVFCLSRRGNLLAQTNGDYSSLLLRACRQETIPLKGFIGDWESIEPVWLKFKENNPTFRPSYESKEILYSYSLRAEDLSLQHDSHVRFLELQDFAEWSALSSAYLNELKLPEDLNEEKKRHDYEARIGERVWWGLFVGGEMVSKAALNSNGEKIGQVGGVFTPKPKRKLGYAKTTMLHMLRDCRDLHGHKKSILFTGETDYPAQKLYESIGYQRIGSFALIFS